MSEVTTKGLRIGIACGGTGGHLFPGLALVEEFSKHGVETVLFTAGTSIEKLGLAGRDDLNVVVLPMVGLTPARAVSFLRGLATSYRLARKTCRRMQVAAVVGMGGYVCAPVILAARSLGLKTFLHEPNVIPGRANKLLARVVDRVFVGVGPAMARFKAKRTLVTGIPVRSEFFEASYDSAECRRRLGLDPSRDVLLVMGGSQGAKGINDLIIRSLKLLREELPETQIVHLTGPADYKRVRDSYVGVGLNHVVMEFSLSMPVLMRSATIAVSRAGASTLAEFAAIGLPAILIPYPYAVGDHQLHNALLYERAGGAVVILQSEATPERFVPMLKEIICGNGRLLEMRKAMARMAVPNAAARIVEIVTELVASDLSHRDALNGARGAIENCVAA